MYEWRRRGRKGTCIYSITSPNQLPFLQFLNEINYKCCTVFEVNNVIVAFPKVYKIRVLCEFCSVSLVLKLTFTQMPKRKMAYNNNVNLDGKKHGYPLTLLDTTTTQDISDIVCRQCKLILNVPYQTHCGHCMCKECLVDLFKSVGGTGDLEKDPKSFPCPYCEEEEDGKKRIKTADNNGGGRVKKMLNKYTVFNADYLNAKLNKRQVKCPNEGCGYSCTFETWVKEHRRSCTFEMVPCTACGELVKKFRQEEHLKEECVTRLVNCEFCNGSVEFMDMKEHLRTYCQKFPEACEECGKEGIERIEMGNHLENDCGMKMIECISKDCGGKMRRGDYEKHLKGAPEKHMAALHMEHDRRLFRMEKCMESMIQDVGKVKRLKKREERGGGDITERLDALENQLVQLSVTLSELDVESVVAYRLQQRLSADRFVYTIENFNEKRKQVREGKHTPVYYSPEFYVRGYRLKLKYYPEGEGSGLHRKLSLYITFVQGDYDDEFLVWPMPNKYRLSLWALKSVNGSKPHKSINCAPNEQHVESFQKPIAGCENVAIGKAGFIRHEHLNKGGVYCSAQDNLYFEFYMEG